MCAILNMSTCRHDRAIGGTNHAQRERSEGMKFAACPNCRVQYPLQRLGAHPEAGKTYTVLCSVCGNQFDVTFVKRWLMPLKTVTR